MARDGIDVMGGVKFYIGVHISAEEMKDWPAETVIAFFDGIAKVIAARDEGLAAQTRSLARLGEE